MSAAHERQKMAQAVMRFCDAVRAYVAAVCREQAPLWRHTNADRSASPIVGLPILRLAAAIFGISAVVLVLKALQS